MSTITIGVDLAKSVFSVCEVDGVGHVLRRQDLKRDAFAVWLAQVPAGTVVAMAACSNEHHWARRCLEHGLQPRQPRLIVAQFVTPFCKSRTVKNNRNDAEQAVEKHHPASGFIGMIYGWSALRQRQDTISRRADARLPSLLRSATAPTIGRCRRGGSGYRQQTSRSPNRAPRRGRPSAACAARRWS